MKKIDKRLQRGVSRALYSSSMAYASVQTDRALMETGKVLRAADRYTRHNRRVAALVHELEAARLCLEAARDIAQRETELEKRVMARALEIYAEERADQEDPDLVWYSSSGPCAGDFHNNEWRLAEPKEVWRGAYSQARREHSYNAALLAEHGMHGF